MFITIRKLSFDRIVIVRKGKCFQNEKSNIICFSDSVSN